MRPYLDRSAVLDLTERYPSSAQLASVSEKQLVNRLVKLAPRMGKRRAAKIVQALSEQTAIVLGTLFIRLMIDVASRAFTSAAGLATKNILRAWHLARGNGDAS